MGMTPIERLKLRTGDHLAAREAAKKSGVGLVHPWAVALGVLLLVAGMSLANYRLNDWVDLPLMMAGVCLMMFGYRQRDEES